VGEEEKGEGEEGEISLFTCSAAWCITVLPLLSTYWELSALMSTCNHRAKCSCKCKWRVLELRCIPTAFTRSPSIPFLLHGGDHMRMKLAVHIPAMLWCHASAQTNEWLSSHPYRREKDLWRRDRDTNGGCGLHSPQPYISLSDVHHQLM